MASAAYVVAGGSTCTRANPVVTMSPSQSQSVAPGTPVAFAVSVTDNDSSAAVTAQMTASSTGNTTGAGAAACVSFNAKSSTNIQYSTTNYATSISSGSYSIGTSATDASATSYSGSAAATYVASASTSTGSTISVITNSPNYLPGQTVSITVAVSSGGSPVSGANVSVIVSPPTGNSTNLNGTTGSNGVAVLSLRLKKQAAAGTYQAQAGIATTGRSASSIGASTTFLVQ